MFGGALTEPTASGDGPSPPSLPIQALTWGFSASLACNARFQMFLAELASRSSSNEHRTQMTFLLLLPILQLVEGFLPRCSEKRAPLPGGSVKWGTEVCMVCQTLLAPTPIICPRPAHASTPSPTPQGWPRCLVIFSLPYNIWPQRLQLGNSDGSGQLASSRRRHTPPSLETWLGVALSLWNMSTSLPSGAVSPRGGMLAQRPEGWGGWGRAHRESSPVGRVGIPAATSSKL